MRNKVVVVVSVLLGIYVVLGLAFGGAIGHFQPQDDGTKVLKTFDSNGNAHETVLRPVEDKEGQIWLLSGQWFRGWYNRALENSDIELQGNDNIVRFRAIPLEDMEEFDRVIQLRTNGASSAAIYFQRAMLLFAPVKILKLEATPQQ